VALPAPNLDDRGYADLVDDAVRLVRVSCPGWTDEHPSDPGVTLIEAFAFLVDQLIFRLNQVPDRLHVKFLDLIGVRMFPPTPARADITFWLSSPATAETTVPAGTQVATARSDATDPIVFTTLGEAVALPCEVTAVRVRGAEDATSTDRTAQLSAGVAVPAFGDPPADGDLLLIALDRPVPRCAVELDIECGTEGVGIDPEHPPLVWEAHDGQGWSPCRVFRDGTGGLNTAGSVVLDVPADHRTGLVDGQHGAWLRARVITPSGGAPRYSAPPVVTRVTGSTLGVSGEAINARVVRDEVLGMGEGVPGQVFRLSSGPVVTAAEEPVLEVSSTSGWQTWTRVESFAESGPADRHFVLDGTTGEVGFGPVVRLPDGDSRQHGAIPAAGAVVRMRRYAAGGGAGGNVTRGTIRTLKSSIPFVAAVENTRSARGGIDGETLEQARVRAGLTLRSRDRAVTAEDYEVLARRIAPEAARVRCVPAGVAGVTAGSVKVLVVPAASAGADGKVALSDLIPPEPLLARLADHLDRVRPLGTRLMVEPPRYRGVTVVARLIARPRVRPAAVRDDALAALARFLSPLPGGGPDGEGWPFGRGVRAGEIHALLQQVRGVDVVEDVRLFTANPVTGERGPENARIDLDPNSLVFSFDHQVRVETN
jgi:predicted phage baseplate assembly protein